jgi:hypothetical protein
LAERRFFGALRRPAGAVFDGRKLLLQKDKPHREEMILNFIECVMIAFTAVIAVYLAHLGFKK